MAKPVTVEVEYRIVGKRQLKDDSFGLTYVDIEWMAVDGSSSVKDTHTLPQSFDYKTKTIIYKEEPAGERTVVKDQIVVARGTKDSIIMQMCEEKRAAIAALFTPGK